MFENSGDIFSGTSEVREAHRFDEQRLSNWMSDHVPDFKPELIVRQFKGGQSNPTYKLTDGRGRNYVLRRKPPGKLLASAHQVDREFRVLSAIEKTGFPAPCALALCTDDDVIGSMFYVMDCVDGINYWDQRMPGIDPDYRAAVYDSMNETLTKLHKIDYKAIGLADFGPEGSYVARQVHRWTKQYRLSESTRIDIMERLIEWMAANIPAEAQTTLVHGDFRLDNMLFHPSEPRVVAVLDWEISTIGDPLADLGFNTHGWYVSPDLLNGFEGIDMARELPGIPDIETYLAAYRRRMGVETLENWGFYVAYNLFRMAAIFQGIAGRVRDGTNSNPAAVTLGEKVEPLAWAAWHKLEEFKLV